MDAGLISHNKIQALLPELKISYQNAEIFPHVILDNFLDGDQLRLAAKYFPSTSEGRWIQYQHFNESKAGLNKREAIPAPLLEVIDNLNSPAFVAWLSELTGIPNLIADPSLEGGGLHQVKAGGFVNIHADYTVHPHHRHWQRRVNVLIYLNEDWDENFGGQLEFWTKDMKRPFKYISPIFNRCVIFNTTADSFHGHPKPLECPESRTRKSIALYYFTNEIAEPIKKATNFRARPEDGLKSILIYLDTKLIAIYNFMKGKLGINDDFISKILGALARLRGR